jgi:acyl carrier protein
VPNLEVSIRAAEQMGAKVVTTPVPDVAFDGRRIAFLFHEAHGMFEFVEAYPATASGSGNAEHVTLKTPPIAQSSPSATALRSRLASVLRRIFPELGKDQIAQAALNVTRGWDSLGHIRFMMSVEAEFEVNIPAARIPELTSFEQIFAYLENNAASMEQL